MRIYSNNKQTSIQWATLQEIEPTIRSDHASVQSPKFPYRRDITNFPGDVLPRYVNTNV